MNAQNQSVGVKVGLAEMLKGGVIMDVVTPDQARIAEEAGAVSVMALERVPSDIRRDGGVARMSPPELVCGSSLSHRVRGVPNSRCLVELGGSAPRVRVRVAQGVDWRDGA